MPTESQPSELLETLYAAINTGDITQLQDLAAPDILAIGTDPDEWLQGRDKLMPVLQAQFRDMSNSGVTVTAGNPTIGVNDSAVWLADLPTIHRPGGPDTPLRLTLTASRDDKGHLMIQQLHFSFGVPDDQVFDSELPG